jgi:hypothetical protein
MGGPMRRPGLAGTVLLGLGFLAICGGNATAVEAAGHPLSGPTAPPRAVQSGSPGYRAAAPAQPGAPIRASLDRIEILEPGASDRGTLRAAKSALPLGRLTPQGRRRAEMVLSNLSMFRSMPTVKIDVDHDSYRYFVEHPDVAVSIWRVLGVSKCQLWQTGPDAYETDVGDGSTGIIDVLLRSERDHIVVGEGRFKSPLLAKPIRANALLHLRTEYVTHPDGGTEAICRGALFVAFPSQTVETAAKVISPVTNMVIDRNFEEVGLFAHMMSLAMRNRPGWVESIAGQLDGVLEKRKLELIEVTARAHAATRQRTGESVPVSAEELAVPLPSGAPAAEPRPLRLGE